MAQEKTLFILASARGDSNTEKALKKFFPDASPTNTIDLRNCNIGYYDYDQSKNAGDDFIKIAERMRDSDKIVFATPVYWYSMSGLMKVFFDRLSDLLTSHKSLGRALKGRKVAVVATGSNPKLPEGFETPFELTSDYFEMLYLGISYISAQASS